MVLSCIILLFRGFRSWWKSQNIIVWSYRVIINEICYIRNVPLVWCSNHPITIMGSSQISWNITWYLPSTIWCFISQIPHSNTYQITYHQVNYHSHRKSPFSIAKPSINGPFPMSMLNNQRVSWVNYADFTIDSMLETGHHPQKLDARRQLYDPVCCWLYAFHQSPQLLQRPVV
jgi:hypothetical protein